jgi:hypothetical protein
LDPHKPPVLVHHISALEMFAEWTIDELRLKDYELYGRISVSHPPQADQGPTPRYTGFGTSQPQSGGAGVTSDPVPWYAIPEETQGTPLTPKVRLWPDMTGEDREELTSERPFPNMAGILSSEHVRQDGSEQGEEGGCIVRVTGEDGQEGNVRLDLEGSRKRYVTIPRLVGADMQRKLTFKFDGSNDPHVALKGYALHLRTPLASWAVMVRDGDGPEKQVSQCTQKPSEAPEYHFERLKADDAEEGKELEAWNTITITTDNRNGLQLKGIEFYGELQRGRYGNDPFDCPGDRAFNGLLEAAESAKARVSVTLTGVLVASHGVSISGLASPSKDALALVVSKKNVIIERAPGRTNAELIFDFGHHHVRLTGYYIKRNVGDHEHRMRAWRLKGMRTSNEEDGIELDRHVENDEAVATDDGVLFFHCEPKNAKYQYIHLVQDAENDPSGCIALCGIEFFGTLYKQAADDDVGRSRPYGRHSDEGTIPAKRGLRDVADRGDEGLEPAYEPFQLNGFHGGETVKETIERAQRKGTGGDAAGGLHFQFVAARGADDDLAPGGGKTTVRSMRGAGQTRRVARTATMRSKRTSSRPIPTQPEPPDGPVVLWAPGVPAHDTICSRKDFGTVVFLDPPEVAIRDQVIVRFEGKEDRDEQTVELRIEPAKDDGRDSASTEKTPETVYYALFVVLELGKIIHILRGQLTLDELAGRIRNYLQQWHDQPQDPAKKRMRVQLVSHNEKAFTFKMNNVTLPFGLRMQSAAVDRESFEIIH